jgi:hypothetical protein
MCQAILSPMGLVFRGQIFLKSLKARLLRYALYTMRCRATLAMTCLRVFPQTAKLKNIF